MPELHQLTPSLASLQSKGFHVALVTDGRMSGASGSVPAAIHVTPEAMSGGPLGRVTRRRHHPAGLRRRRARGKVPATSGGTGTAHDELAKNEFGAGRELFASLRRAAGEAEAGAISSCEVASCELSLM